MSTFSAVTGIGLGALLVMLPGLIRPRWWCALAALALLLTVAGLPDYIN